MLQPEKREHVLREFSGVEIRTIFHVESALYRRLKVSKYSAPSTEFGGKPLVCEVVVGATQRMGLEFGCAAATLHLLEAVQYTSVLYRYGIQQKCKVRYNALQWNTKQYSTVRCSVVFSFPPAAFLPFENITNKRMTSNFWRAWPLTAASPKSKPFGQGRLDYHLSFPFSF